MRIQVYNNNFLSQRSSRILVLNLRYSGVFKILAKGLESFFRPKTSDYTVPFDRPTNLKISKKVTRNVFKFLTNYFFENLNPFLVEISTFIALKGGP